MLKVSKRLFFATLLMCSLLFMSLSNFAYAEENKSDTEKKENVTNNESTPEPPSGPDVQKEEVEEEVEIETPASVTGEKFQGTGTVTDFSTTGSKAFYTITDKDHNVFYLIVDLDKTENNVYFLSDIKKSEIDGTAAGENTDNAKPNIPNQNQVGAETTKPISEQPKEEGNSNTFLLVVLLIATIGVVAYYFLVIKKKKNQKVKNENENEEMMEDDYYEDDSFDHEDETNKHNKED